MNYRHAFHAGNFADVHKHIVLTLLIEHLHKKPAPCFVMDTHAGRGEYDLQSSEAQRSGEWRAGIDRVRTASDEPTVKRYLELTTSTSRYYFGSPLIVATTLRDCDRAVFVEKHPDEGLALRRALGKRRRVTVLEDDGYAQLKAQLPPKENRGLVLIDPPYENSSEFIDAAQALQLALKRWPNGVYCLWFPIKPGGAHERLCTTLMAAQIKKLLLATLSIRPDDSPLGLNGSGLIIANPPWQLDVQLRELQPKLHRALAQEGSGGCDVRWLAGE